MAIIVHQCQRHQVKWHMDNFVRAWPSYSDGTEMLVINPQMITKVEIQESGEDSHEYEAVAFIGADAYVIGKFSDLQAAQIFFTRFKQLGQ